MKPAGEVLFFSLRNFFIKIAKKGFGCVMTPLLFVLDVRCDISYRILTVYFVIARNETIIFSFFLIEFLSLWARIVNPRYLGFNGILCHCEERNNHIYCFLLIEFLSLCARIVNTPIWFHCSCCARNESLAVSCRFFNLFTFYKSIFRFVRTLFFFFWIIFMN